MSRLRNPVFARQRKKKKKGNPPLFPITLAERKREEGRNVTNPSFVPLKGGRKKTLYSHPRCVESTRRKQKRKLSVRWGIEHRRREGGKGKKFISVIPHARRSRSKRRREREGENKGIAGLICA